MQVRGARVVGPAAEVVADPGGELDRLEIGPSGLVLRPCHEQERVDDLPEPEGLAVDVFEGAPVFRGGAVAAECDFDLAEHGRQGGP